MRKPNIILTVALAGPLAACSSSPKSLDQVPEFNTWLATAMQDSAMRNAIIAQHTLFPYHFEAHSEELNELGRLDLAILAGHYLDRSGELSVRQGGVGKDLYEARVAMVRGLLERAGVAPERIEISDSLAGGEGLSSENVVRILEEDREGGPRGSSRAGSGQDRNGSRGMGRDSGPSSSTSTGSGSQYGGGTRS